MCFASNGQTNVLGQRFFSASKVWLIISVEKISQYGLTETEDNNLDRVIWQIF